MNHFTTIYLKIGINKHIGNINIRINFGDVQDDIGIIIMIIINKQTGNTKRSGSHNILEQDIKNEKNIKNDQNKSGTATSRQHG